MLFAARLLKSHGVLTMPHLQEMMSKLALLDIAGRVWGLMEPAYLQRSILKPKHASARCVVWRAPVPFYRLFMIVPESWI